MLKLKGTITSFVAPLILVAGISYLAITTQYTGIIDLKFPGVEIRIDGRK